MANEGTFVPTTYRKGYVALQVTLTVASTPYRILDLLNALLPSGVEMAGAVRELNLQNAAGNTAPILVGGHDIGTSYHIGYQLDPPQVSGLSGASRLYRAMNSAVNLGELYVYSTGTGQVLNVEAMVL